jgi:tetratricopeptide (TPR) repeat protein
MRTAHVKRKQGRIEESLEAWRRAIDLHGELLSLRPEVAAIHNNRGVARAELEKLLAAQGRTVEATTARMKAIQDFERAVALDRVDPAALVNRAMAKERLADHLDNGGLPEEARSLRAEAEGDYRTALELAAPVSPLHDEIVAALASLKRRTE